MLKVNLEKDINISTMDIISFTEKNTSDGQVKVLAKKGTLITRETVKGMHTYTIDDKPINPQLLVALKKVIPERGKAKDDDIFGTNELKKVGDSWVVNTKVAIDNMKESGVELGEKDLAGKVKLLKKEIYMGKESLFLEGFMASNKFDAPPNMKLPPNAIVKSSNFKTKFQGHFPTDLKIPRLSTFADMNMSMEIDIPKNGQAVTLKIEFKTKKIMKRLKIKSL